jgi:hypothetical protein
MVTLTEPHLRGHSLEQRFAFLLDAWPPFLRSLNDWLREKGIGKGTREQVAAHPGRYVHWYKVTEWVPAQDDNSGHPHFHVWFYSPWLEQDLLQSWWRRALENVGFGDASGVLPYIECVYGDPSKELVKYIFKDIDSDGSKIPPVVMAKLYQCRDQKRFTQGSRGFIQLGESDPSCPECHVPYALMRPDRPFTQSGMRRTFNDLMRTAQVEAIVTRSISGHLTERMQEHYSTVSGAEQRAGIAKVIDLMAPKKRDHAARGARRPRRRPCRDSIPGAPLGASKRRIRAPILEPWWCSEWCSAYGRWCSNAKSRHWAGFHLLVIIETT